VLTARYAPSPDITQIRLVLKGLKYINTMWTGDADLRLYIKTVQDG